MLHQLPVSIKNMKRAVAFVGPLTQIRHVKMLGTSFTGTTLLAMLLDTHPQMASIGELAYCIRAGQPSLETPYLCSCGVPIGDCEFFRQVREICARVGVDLDLYDFGTQLGRHLPRQLRRILFGTASRHLALQSTRDAAVRAVPGLGRHVDDVMTRSELVAAAVLEASGKQIFVDSSQGFDTILPMLRRPRLRLQVIHVVRDVRAIAQSNLNRGRLDVAKTVRNWKRVQSAGLALEPRLGPRQYLRLRLEEFCQYPERSLEQVCEFLHVETSDMIGLVNERPHHVIGNTMRLQPIRPITADEKWRSSLEPSQLHVCQRLAGKLNQRLGYEG